MIFYNPADFASVLNGTIEPYEPQPYATLDIDEHLFLNATVENQLLGTGDQRRYRIGEMAYDRERNYLYVFERFADGSKPVVHIWGISSTNTRHMDLPAGWSMISIPLIPENASVSSLFPEAVVVYGYERGVGYDRIRAEENLETGRGYWILFNAAQSLTLTGQPIMNYIQQVDEDGWAMIGGCSSDAEASSENCSIGVIYRYVQGAGYQRITESETIKSGKGYWIQLHNITGQAGLRVEATGGS